MDYFDLFCQTKFKNILKSSDYKIELTSWAKLLSDAFIFAANNGIDVTMDGSIDLNMIYRLHKFANDMIMDLTFDNKMVTTWIADFVEKVLFPTMIEPNVNIKDMN